MERILLAEDRTHERTMRLSRPNKARGFIDIPKSHEFPVNSHEFHTSLPHFPHKPLYNYPPKQRVNNRLTRYNPGFAQDFSYVETSLEHQYECVRSFPKKVVNNNTKKFDKKAVSCNVLRRTSSAPISTDAGAVNRTRTILVAKSVPVKTEEVNEDEKWAGPAYSKSPPPSSLPFPRFSVQKPLRSISMELAYSDYDSPSNLPLPSRSSSPSLLPQSPLPAQNCWDAAFATRDLKRILNLDQQVVT